VAGILRSRTGAAAGPIPQGRPEVGSGLTEGVGALAPVPENPRAAMSAPGHVCLGGYTNAIARRNNPFNTHLSLNKSNCW